MSSIKIIEVPPGLVPEIIRREWVGVCIPLATEEELRKNPFSGLRIGNQNIGGYIVLRERAVEALRAAGKYAAADFWNTMPVISTASYLEFSRDVCEVVG